MKRKTTNIVAYFGVLGFIIAFVFGEREESRFHLNQALVLYLTATVLALVSFILGNIPNFLGVIFRIIALLCNTVLSVLWLMGFIQAVVDNENGVPLLRRIKILK